MTRTVPPARTAKPRARRAPVPAPRTPVVEPVETPEEIARRTRSTRPGPGEHAAGPKVRPVAKPDGDAPAAPALPEYDWDEIVRHDAVGDYWVAFAGGVFDVSEWLYHHPGGPEVFIDAYGQNATKAFGKAGHSADAWHAAQSFKIGTLKKGSTPPRGLGRPRLTATAPAACPVAHGGTGRPSPAPVDTIPAAPAGDGPLDIPWAVRWLVPQGERFANWDILNDNDTQLEGLRRFGHVYACGVPTKKWRIVVVSDPDLLDEVAGDEEQFGKTTDEINFFAQLASSRGGGISVVADSDYYERVRRIMLPWYAPAHQKTQFDRMKEQAKKLLAAWQTFDDATPLDMRQWMERYTLEISGRGACNYDFGLLDVVDGAVQEKTPFAAAVTDSTKESVRRVVEPRPDLALPGTKKGRAKKKYEEQNSLLFATMDNVVKGRIGICPMGEQTDLLTRLITVPDPDSKELLAPEEVRDQLLMHLSNGFNGPSITGAWIAHVLASYPDVEEKLVAEIDAVTGGDPDYELQYTDLMALPYMTQVIKETLRIYPPMPITIRRSLKDGTLGRYRIRKDDIIFVGALAAHRDPRFWGPDADVFDPDQFAMEKVVERPRHAFVPFSVGPRQCMAQEVTFMMLRVGLFEIYNRYRLRSAGPVVKNTAATTKPVAVPVVRVPREGKQERQEALALRRSRAKAVVAAGAVDGDRSWDRPSEIPVTSAHRTLVVAYGSNFGSSKELAERYAERSRTYGYDTQVVALNDLVEMPARTQPWLLTIMTATYTANPPSNAIAFKTWLEGTDAGCETWRNCSYLVWGLGNSQWNAFLAFPRYVDTKLAELGATRLDGLGFGDVGSPVWEDVHTTWNDRTWPQLLELSGAAPSEAAAARVAAEKAAEEALTATDSTSAMALSLDGEIVAPTLMTNAVGITTHQVRALVCRELQAPESPTRTRHLEISLPPDFAYTAGDHLGVCPQNDEETVERLAAKLGAALDGVFSVPKSMKVRAVPKGVALQVRNVLTCLVDITSMPSVALVDLLLEKVTEPDQRAGLEDLKAVLTNPTADSPLATSVRAGGYDVLALLEEFDSVSLNVFELLQVVQPLRPRYYSTSSSPRIHGNGTAHVSIGRNVSPVPGMPHRQFRGMSSHYVHTLREGDRMNVFLDRAEGFHLQEDVTKPMVFVSAGTGYAPMRAFLWERLAMKRAGTRIGPAALFNGIRASALDYIYRDEIQMFVDEGVLEHLHVAMSREVPGRRDYVQGRITEQGALVWKLVKAGGHVYLCGSQTMRDDARAAFVGVVAKHGKMSPAAAEAYLVSMETTEDRYRPDVWG
ncbi:MAG: putative bifunctional reductase2 [Frankiales bacterium]|nr:putative bifunctional reductase2 [Frankiales bacterium]